MPERKAQKPGSALLTHRIPRTRGSSEANRRYDVKVEQDREQRNNVLDTAKLWATVHGARSLKVRETARSVYGKG